MRCVSFEHDAWTGLEHDATPRKFWQRIVATMSDLLIQDKKMPMQMHLLNLSPYL